MISAENWTTSCYYNENLQVFISLCGDYNPNTGEPETFYSIITLDRDNQELFSKNFLELKECIVEMNQRFGSWSYSPVRFEKLPSSSGGCGDCSAK